MGRIGSPFGVQGWVRIQTYSSDPDTLLDHERWWIRRPPAVGAAARTGSAGSVMQRPGARRATAAAGLAAAVGAPLAQAEWREVDVLEAQGHGSGLIAQLDGIGDRDQAAQANGIEIGLLRDDLPPPEEDEFYWEDLIGLDATTPLGSYTLISGSVDPANLDNVGSGAAYSLGDGRSAYFESGGLSVVVVPEPGSWALVGLGVAAVAVGRLRRRSAAG